MALPSPRPLTLPRPMPHQCRRPRKATGGEGRRGTRFAIRLSLLLSLSAFREAQGQRLFTLFLCVHQARPRFAFNLANGDPHFLPTSPSALRQALHGLESSGAGIQARIRSAESSGWTVAAPTASTDAFWGVNGGVNSISATSSDQKALRRCGSDST